MGRYKAKVKLWPEITTVGSVTLIKHKDGLTFHIASGVMSFYRSRPLVGLQGEAKV